MAAASEESFRRKAKFSQEQSALQDKLMELANLAATAMEQSVRAVLTRMGTWPAR